MITRLLAGILVLFLTGCASGPTQPTQPEQVEVLYNRAADLLERGRYTEAGKAFEDVDRQYPYSVWATRAQMMLAYAKYMSNEYDESLLSLDRFISLHPGNSHTAYAYYLRALIFYERISDVERDQKITGQALTALEDVVNRWPDTPYARAAQLKIDLVHDHLAGKEMAIGLFYLKRGMSMAAIKRFRTVVEHYQTTTHTPEALYRLVETWVSLGVLREARTVAAVLGYNFPDSPWYRKAYGLLKDSPAVE